MRRGKGERPGYQSDRSGSPGITILETKADEEHSIARPETERP